MGGEYYKKLVLHFIEKYKVKSCTAILYWRQHTTLIGSYTNSERMSSTFPSNSLESL